ncbi:MAG: ChbG/HpnK family deacetylase [Bauldia sp.]
MSDGVDSGTVELVRMGRIHAVSCLTAPRRWPMAAQRLRELPSEVSIGLHLTLTAIPEAGPTAPGAAEPGDPGPAGLILRGLLGRLDRDAIAHRLRCQLDLFEDGLGRPPDHLDGHQHAQAVFGIPDLLHEVLAERYGAALPWVRVTAPCLPAAPGAALNRWVIERLGRHQRRVLAATPLRANRSFGGIRRFNEPQPYADLLEVQLRAATATGTLIMCHPAADPSSPGDPIAGARRTEFAFLAGSDLPAVLDRSGCRLGPLAATALSELPGG